MTNHPRTLRVLYLAKTSDWAPWAVRQVRDHVRLGIDAHVVVPPGGARIAEYQAAGATVHLLRADIPVCRPWAGYDLRRSIRALVDQLDPDIIHCYHVGTALAVRLALGKRHPIPRVFQVPGVLHLEHNAARMMEIATAGPRDYWIGVCEPIRAAYQQANIAADQLFVADYGIDLDVPFTRLTGNLRAELGVGPETKLVGMVGLMYPPKRYLAQRRGVKGHEDLIDALAIVVRRHLDVCGVFVGGAWNNATGYEERVRAYAQAVCGDRAVFLGTRSDVRNLIAQFDLFVQPSHSEGVAGTTKEALLLRMPVIATDVGGQAEVILHGETGWLVSPKDPRALARTIEEALHDPARARAMAAKGYDYLTGHFDGKRKSAEVVGIYRRILARERRVRTIRAQSDAAVAAVPSSLDMGKAAEAD